MMTQEPNPVQMLLQSLENISLNVLNINASEASISPVNTNTGDEMSETLISEENDPYIVEIFRNTEGVQLNEEQKKDEAKMIWPPKTKIDKKLRKQKFNAKTRRLILPKSPIMVFNELYHNVQIKLQENDRNGCTIYAAYIEVDNQIYIGQHMSRMQAKQKACDNFLRALLVKKITEPPVRKESVEVFNSAATTTQGHPKEDFPWPHYVSLAMHNLLDHWELQSVRKRLQNKKPTSMIKFPDNPTDYNPVGLFYQLLPDITFCDKKISANNSSYYECSCEIKDITFVGTGPTKKKAKKECAIAAIKYNWGFDYHANQV